MSRRQKCDKYVFLLGAFPNFLSVKIFNLAMFQNTI